MSTLRARLSSSPCSPFKIFSLFINAKYEYCVSSYIAKECRIPTFQIEINLKYRSSIYNEYEKYNKLIGALKEIITLIDNKIN